MRVAALDLGSNSFHLLIVETRPDGSWVPLVREKEMLRLGDLVAREGFLPQDDIERAAEVVRRFKAIADSKQVDELVAYGTAALREAANGPEATEQIEEVSGIPIQVVSGIREAQLVFEAVRASVVMEPAPVLCADLGGGSLELAIGDRNGLHFATSLHLGVGRLTAELVRSDPPTTKDLGRLRRRVESELNDVLGDILSRSPRQLVGTSGTFCALTRASAALRDGVVPTSVNQLTVSGADLRGFAELVFSLDADDRARLPGIDARRAELLPAGAVVAEALLDLTGIDSLTSSEWAMREGMVLRVLGRHDRVDFGADPRAIRRASVLSLCRRSGWRERHGYAVERLAGQLFDATASLHGLSDHDRELLELAALLHDIGEHVSRDSHARHSAYLIEHGGLRGCSPDEVKMLTCLGRYHTRGKPRESFPAWEGLDEADRDRALSLLSLLRLADGFDTSHAGVISQVDVRLSPDAAVFAVTARGDAELEAWMFHRKRALFEDVFGLEAVLEVHRLGPDEFQPDTLAEAAGLS